MHTFLWLTVVGILKDLQKMRIMKDAKTNHETMETPDCRYKRDPGETVVLYQLKRTVNISLKKTKYLY